MMRLPKVDLTVVAIPGFIGAMVAEHLWLRAHPALLVDPTAGPQPLGLAWAEVPPRPPSRRSLEDLESLRLLRQTIAWLMAHRAALADLRADARTNRAMRKPSPARSRC